MKAPGHAFLLAAALSLHNGATGAALDALEHDGWYTWRTAAAADAPARCCYAGNWVPAEVRCDLDGRHSAYGNCGDPRTANGVVQVYVRIESGEIAKLRALGPSCAVEAASPVLDLGTVDVAENLHWLERLMFSDASPDVRQHAAFAVSQSSSPQRIPALIRQGQQDADGETRAKAWFWLARTGASEAESEIMQAIAADPDAQVRQEIVSALSQLPGERAVDAMIAVLKNRQLDLAVREEALFWLAHSETDRALAIL